MVEAVRVGGGLDAAVLEAGDRQLAAKLRKAEDEAALYDRAEKALEGQVSGKVRAVEGAKRKVEDCARAVIRSSDAAARLIADFETLQNELIARRVALRFLMSNGLPVGDLADRIKTLMRQELPPDPERSTYTNWKIHNAHLKWQAALEGLTNDADFALPEK